MLQAISVGIRSLMVNGAVSLELRFSDVESLAMFCPSLFRIATSKYRVTSKNALFVRFPSKMTNRSPVESSMLNVKLKVSVEMTANETVTMVCKLNPKKNKENS